MSGTKSGFGVAFHSIVKIENSFMTDLAFFMELAPQVHIHLGKSEKIQKGNQEICYLSWLKWLSVDMRKMD